MGAAIAAPCELPGEPAHWIADYCMLSLQTDDEIAAGDCIARELAGARKPACAEKRRYKRAMCEVLVARRQRTGVAACMADAGFVGNTVRHGGVGR